jgi:hypothetical protein
MVLPLSTLTCTVWPLSITLKELGRYSKPIGSRSTLMPPRMLIGDWRAPSAHLANSGFRRAQFCGPASPV